MTKQRIVDQKHTILVRHLLPEGEIETIGILVNHLPPGVVEPFENIVNKENVEPGIEDLGVGEERKRDHDAFGEVVYPLPLGLYCSVASQRTLP